MTDNFEVKITKIAGELPAPDLHFSQVILNGKSASNILGPYKSQDDAYSGGLLAIETIMTDLVKETFNLKD